MIAALNPIELMSAYNYPTKLFLTHVILDFIDPLATDIAMLIYTQNEIVS